MLRVILVSWWILFLCQCASAQEEDERSIRMEDLPAVIQETVRRVSQGSTIHGLAKETEKGETVYEVELEFQGRKRDVSIDLNVGDLFRADSVRNLWFGYSLHHRSSIFETSSAFGRIRGGSNYNTLSLQYHFCYLMT